MIWRLNVVTLVMCSTTNSLSQTCMTTLHRLSLSQHQYLSLNAFQRYHFCLKIFKINEIELAISNSNVCLCHKIIILKFSLTTHFQNGKLPIFIFSWYISLIKLCDLRNIFFVYSQFGQPFSTTTFDTCALHIVQSLNQTCFTYTFLSNTLHSVHHFRQCSIWFIICQ